MSQSDSRLGPVTSRSSCNFLIGLQCRQLHMKVHEHELTSGQLMKSNPVDLGSITFVDFACSCTCLFRNRV